MQVKSQFGDPCVGGDQFDAIVLDYFVTQIRNFHQVDIRADKYAMMLLAEAAEQAKVELSTQHEVSQFQRLTSSHRLNVLVILVSLFLAQSSRGWFTTW